MKSLNIDLYVMGLRDQLATLKVTIKIQFIIKLLRPVIQSYSGSILQNDSPYGDGEKELFIIQYQVYKCCKIIY